MDYTPCWVLDIYGEPENKELIGRYNYLYQPNKAQYTASLTLIKISPKPKTKHPSFQG
jgi:hypothetical protein